MARREMFCFIIFIFLNKKRRRLSFFCECIQLIKLLGSSLDEAGDIDGAACSQEGVDALAGFCNQTCDLSLGLANL